MVGASTLSWVENMEFIASYLCIPGNLDYHIFRVTIGRPRANGILAAAQSEAVGEKWAGLHGDWVGEEDIHQRPLSRPHSDTKDH